MSTPNIAVPVTNVPDPLRWKTLTVVGIVALMVVLDGTVINIALPSIQTELGLSDAERQWVVTAYALAFGGLLLLGGRLGDFFGRKRSLFIGLTGFAIASAAGGLAPNPLSLILARGAGGAFAALLAPVTLAIIAVTFTEIRERTRAFAIYSAISAGGGAVGLVLGGVLTQFVSWRWCLWINVPIAIIAMVLTVPWIRESRVLGRVKFDIAGALVGTTGLLLLVFGISEAGTDGWTGSMTVIPLVCAIALIVAFVFIELRSKNPLLPMRVLSNRSRSGAYLAAFFSGGALFATFLFISYYLQAVLGYSPLGAGLLGLPFSVGVVASTFVANFLLPKLGPRNVTTIGFALAIVGTLGLTRIQATSNYWVDVLPSLLVMSVGMGLIFVPLTVTSVYGVKEQDTGVASALVNMSQQIGGSIGVALLNTFAFAATAGAATSLGVSETSPDALVVGYATAFAWGAGLLAIGGVLWFILVRVKLADLVPPAPNNDDPVAVAS
jgi:EmrB/QacA subfamily drug resistance transporter